MLAGGLCRAVAGTGRRARRQPPAPAAPFIKEKACAESGVFMQALQAELRRRKYDPAFGACATGAVGARGISPGLRTAGSARHREMGARRHAELLPEHPVQGALDLGRPAWAALGGGVVGTAQFDDVALRVLAVRAGDVIGVAQPHFPAGREAEEELLRRILPGSRRQ